MLLVTAALLLVDRFDLVLNDPHAEVLLGIEQVEQGTAFALYSYVELACGGVEGTIEVDRDECGNRGALVEVGAQCLFAVCRVGVANGEGGRSVRRQSRQYGTVEAGHGCTVHTHYRRHLVGVVHGEFVGHVAHVVSHPHVVCAARYESAKHVQPVGAVHAGQRGEVLDERLARIGCGIAGKLCFNAVVVGVAVGQFDAGSEQVIAVGASVGRQLHFEVGKTACRQRAFGLQRVLFATVQAVGERGQGSFGESVVGHTELDTDLIANVAELGLEAATLDGKVACGYFALDLHFGLQAERVVAIVVGVDPVDTVMDVASVRIGLSVEQQSLSGRQFSGIVHHEVFARDFKGFGQCDFIPALDCSWQVDGLDESRRSERVAQCHIPSCHACGCSYTNLGELCSLQ